MIGFRRFFSKSSEHPLAKDEQVTTLIAELSTSDPVETLNDVTHWLMLLASEEKVKNRPAKLFRIDQAAQAAERKLRQQYIEASRLHKTIEDRIWNAAFEFLEATVNAHLRCILEYRAEKRARGDAELAAMAVRAMRRLDLQAHWIHLRYQPLPETFWEQVYALIKIAEEDEILRTPVNINPATGTQTTFVQETLKLLMMSVAEPRRLTKSQIALARHLTNNLAEEFVWEDLPGSTVVFHIDFSKRAIPARLTQTSERHFMARCFGAGGAVHKLVTGLKQVELGAMPSILAMSDASTYRRADLLEVLARLAQAWSSARPVAEHQHFDKRLYERKPFFIHICVTHGFNSLHARLSGAKGETPAAETGPKLSIAYDEQLDMHLFGFITERTRDQQRRMDNRGSKSDSDGGEICESWVVQDISETGYGVQIKTTPEDWIERDALIGVHYGTSEYQIGIIRRVASESVENTEVGIQLLSRLPQPVSMRPQDSQLSVWETAADTQTYYDVPAILLPGEAPLHNEECLLLAANSYQLHKLYEVFIGEQRRSVKLLDRISSYGNVDQVLFADVTPKGSAPRMQ
jgi:hypothetical protein